MQRGNSTCARLQGEGMPRSYEVYILLGLVENKFDPPIDAMNNFVLMYCESFMR